MEQHALVLAVRIRLAWYWWRQTCAMAGVALSRILLSASHSDVSVARQHRQRAGPRATRNGARADPALLCHPDLLSGDDSHSVSSRRRIANTLREVKEANQGLLDGAILTRDAIRALAADAYAFEALASQDLVGCSSWEIHFQTRPTSPLTHRQPSTPRKTRPQRQSVTPQSARSVSYFRSLTAHQDAIERTVVNPPIPSVTGTPAHVRAARNVLRRAGAALFLPSGSGAGSHSGVTTTAAPRHSSARGLDFAPDAVVVEASISPLDPVGVSVCAVQCTENTQRPAGGGMAAPARASARRGATSFSAENVVRDLREERALRARKGSCTDGGSPPAVLAAQSSRVAHAGAKRAREDSEHVSTPRRSQRLETLYGTGDGP
jgi:hypothetical protein